MMGNSNRAITISSAAERFDTIVDEVCRQLGLAQITANDEMDGVEFYYPACLMHELDGTLMGYFNADELTRVLNGLLEFS